MSMIPSARFPVNALTDKNIQYTLNTMQVVLDEIVCQMHKSKSKCLHLGMCIEELKEGHDELLNTDVSITVLLDVVTHGLPLWFGQQMSRLLLQHSPALAHQTGQSHLRSRHTFIKATLRRGKMKSVKRRNANILSAD